MAKYNFHELEKDHHGRMNERWAIIKAIGQLSREKVVEVDSTSIEIVLTINGTEIDFLKIVTSILSQVDGLVKEEAEKMLERRLGDSYDILSEIEEHLQDKLSGLRGGCDEN